MSTRTKTKTKPHDEPEKLAAMRQCLADREQGLPYLVGSDKQIADFAPVRRQRVAEAYGLVCRLESIAKRTKTAPDQARAEANLAWQAYQELRSKTEVWFWIDQKDTHGHVLLDQQLRKLRAQD